ncbi:HAD family hydrolase [Puniceibacterium sediminis]|uniref:Haloacid dehalogenase superfamily, subfamily IA, variant 3 with third motif having DD or ED n=1 Tax=Puniceibacterium sediminis TaxID=1608407 RepID=A0A238WZ01_9RHOB|nr:HAD family hydrolase [Puniceibacterium sediminis]SNR51591.1 haloacid dehalogenase superfamily, subfamily IA, variant 3 with third motif having DD or ED [Puniceibacterium sediminis]
MPSFSDDIDLVIFDCDGVLVDSEMLSAEVLITELAGVGIHLDQPYIRKHFLGRSFPTVARAINAAFDTDLPEGFEARYRSALLKRFQTELRPTDGVVSVLSRLGCSACVATSSSPPRAQNSLQVTGLAQFFGPNVFTASQVRNGKPAPDLFLFAASQMHVPPDRVLVIEDSRPGMTAGLAAGMKVMRYTGGSHLAGHVPDAEETVTCFDSWSNFPQNLLSSD